MASQSSLLNLPREIRDLIIAFIFAETPYDTLDTRRAELRICNTHAILHRSFVVPPPSWKGCSKFFRTCKQLHHEGMAFLYPQVHFQVTIDGRSRESANVRSRLHSDYPIGAVQSCHIFRYIKSVSLNLMASTAEDVQQLKCRFKFYLDAVSSNHRISTKSVDVYLDGPRLLDQDHGDGLARMLKDIDSRRPPRVYLGRAIQSSYESWEGVEIIHGAGECARPVSG